MASREQFVSMLWPAALQASQRTGIDPRIIVAQAAQETGWGRSAPGNNYFGIKSHGQGGGQTFTTHEVIDGKRVKIKDSFRRFGSPEESVMGYADFMTRNQRYAPMRQAQGLDAQIQALGQSGYATDPNYASSIRNIATSLPDPGPSLPGRVGGDGMVARNFDPQVAAATNTPAFGTMAPQGPIPAPFEIPTAVADYANSPEPKSMGDRLKGLGAGLDDAFGNIKAPRISQPFGDARNTGNALTKVLNSPTIADILLRKRLA